MVDLLGKRLGKWVIDKELGRGGMGRVYLAHADAAPGGDGAGQPREAAVKVLAAELAQEAGFLERFQREIDVLRQLSHPHIVRLYDSGFQDGLYYFAMEYVPGENFDEILLERGRLSWKEVLEIALQLCPALKHAHDHGVIHRDLKPQNLLQAADGTVKLTDFGIAKVFAGKQLTVTGGLVGTAEYLSPEQASGKPVTHRSDLYSFGVVLYTLLTGRTPFHGRSTLDLMHKHRFAQFDSPQRLVPDVPHDLDRIVCGLLEKEPSKRPANGLILQRQLETFRNKVHRREQPTRVTGAEEGTQAAAEPPPGHVMRNQPGTATLVSQLVREELSSERRGGPLARLLNRPWVLAPLFTVCLALLVYGVFLQPRSATHTASDLKQVGEVERLYRLAERLYRDGNLVAARDHWRHLVQVFEDAGPDQQSWVESARRRLAQPELNDLPSEKERWEPVYRALGRAAQLRLDGRDRDAEEILAGIEFFYHDDPAAKEILQEVKKVRGQP